MPITAIDTGLYRIQLPVPLSDSTHGTMTHFELVTVRLRDGDGVEGVGYTYTTGAGGAAVHALIDQGLRPVLQGADPDAIEALWQRMWWRAALRRPRRQRQSGGVRLRHRAVGHEGAPRTARRSGGCSAASIRRCRAMPAASTWSSRWRRC